MRSGYSNANHILDAWVLSHSGLNVIMLCQCNYRDVRIARMTDHISDIEHQQNRLQGSCGTGNCLWIITANWYLVGVEILGHE